jgi:L-ascorbate 6-phosphate lactonase
VGPEERRDIEPYQFHVNDPYDHARDIRLVIPQMMSSREYMQSIRSFPVPKDALAVWYLGQNGFLLKDSTSPLIGIDLYLTNSCARLKTSDQSYRMDRQLPVFIEPEDLAVDVFLTTHSHQDHADPETISRMPKTEDTVFAGPFNAVQVFEACGVPQRACRMLHPGESLPLGTATLEVTFALPTDATDLNHTGLLLTFATGITFYNTGDTAWSERLSTLLPRNVDICTICINGGYNNLSPEYAARIIEDVHPRIAVPCHYDMMVNNVGSPLMFRAALERTGTDSRFHMLRYYEPWLYERTNFQ